MVTHDANKIFLFWTEVHQHISRKIAIFLYGNYDFLRVAMGTKALIVEASLHLSYENLIAYNNS